MKTVKPLLHRLTQIMIELPMDCRRFALWFARIWNIPFGV